MHLDSNQSYTLIKNKTRFKWLRLHTFSLKAGPSFKPFFKPILSQMFQNLQETNTFLKTPLDIINLKYEQVKELKLNIRSNSWIWLIQNQMYTPFIGKETISLLIKCLKQVQLPHSKMHFLKPSFGSPCSSFPMRILQHNINSNGLPFSSSLSHAFMIKWE